MVTMLIVACTFFRSQELTAAAQYLVNLFYYSFDDYDYVGNVDK